MFTLFYKFPYALNGQGYDTSDPAVSPVQKPVDSNSTCMTMAVWPWACHLPTFSSLEEAGYQSYNSTNSEACLDLDHGPTAFCLEYFVKFILLL